MGDISKSVAAAFASLAAHAAAMPVSAQDFELQNEADMFIALQDDEEPLQTSELTWKSVAKWRPSETVRFFLSTRIRIDPVDKLEPGRPAQEMRSDINKRLLIGDSMEVELREAYVALDVLDTDFTLGKQQIVWGQADGLKVRDIVNPQSFRSFILEDFDQSRIPLWSVKVARRLGPFDIQGLWIPDRTYHEIPSPDAAFGFTSLRYLPPVGPNETLVALNPAQRPDRLAGDADYGGKISVFAWGWDIGLHALRHYNDRPVYHLQPANGGLTATPIYDRQTTYGASFAKPVGGIVFRGELAYASGVAWNAAPAGPPEERIIEEGKFSYVVAADWRGIENTLLSLQYFQDRAFVGSKPLLRPKNDNFITFYARHETLQDRLTVDFQWLTNLNDGDGLLRPKIRYELSDSLRFMVGGDWFYGNRQGVFGEFRNVSRAYLRIECNL